MELSSEEGYQLDDVTPRSIDFIEVSGYPTGRNRTGAPKSVFEFRNPDGNSEIRFLIPKSECELLRKLLKPRILRRRIQNKFPETAPAILCRTFRFNHQA